MDDMIYRPREIYETQLKRQFHDEAEAYIEELTKQAGTNIEENKLHVKAYNEAKKKEDEAAKKAGRGKALGIFLIVLAILCIVGGIVMFFIGQTWAYVVGPILLVLAIVLFVIRFTKIKQILKIRKELLEKAKAESQKRLDVCYADLASLNALFDWNMPVNIMNKATSLLVLDPYFSNERMRYLIEQFGYEENKNYLSSVVQVTSGMINGNPFILEKVHGCEIKPKIWTGSLVITWTTIEHDSDGKSYTRTHTQTLVAEVEKPAPFYDLTTRIVYGNEAAPHLTFSRYPSGVSGKSEKEIASFVKSKVKELDKLEKKALKDEKNNFTKMGNDEFDALFGAYDRNNEVEFRLLFTPLAQNNELDLIKKPEPFGDDFVMMKDKMITSVATRHSQDFDYSARPSLFYGYDYEAVRKRFVTYCDDYIRNLYYDLAPIMAIPLYQNHQPHNYIYKDVYNNYFPSHEHETLAHGLSAELFRPDAADPSLPVLLKSIGVSKAGTESDQVQIKGTSYKTVQHTEMVPKMGRDGHTHMVPVPWTEYIEVQKDSYVGISKVGSNQGKIAEKIAAMDKKVTEGNLYYERGLAIVYEGKKPKNDFLTDLDKLRG